MELNFEGFEMQKLNIPTDRAQRANEKNEVICVIIMITLGVMVIKMYKNGSSFVPYADASKKSGTVWTKYLHASERSYFALSENAMDCWILSYH